MQRRCRGSRREKEALSGRWPATGHLGILQPRPAMKAKRDHRSCIQRPRIPSKRALSARYRRIRHWRMGSGSCDAPVALVEYDQGSFRRPGRSAPHLRTVPFPSEPGRTRAHPASRRAIRRDRLRFRHAIPGKRAIPVAPLGSRARQHREGTNRECHVTSAVS